MLNDGTGKRDQSQLLVRMQNANYWRTRQEWVSKQFKVLTAIVLIIGIFEMAFLFFNRRMVKL